MVVNNQAFSGWPFVNHSMEVRNTQTERGTGRQTIVYPRRKFTFLVEFFINPRALENIRLQTDLPQHLKEGRLLATLRSIDHPRPSVRTKRLRSYNKDVLVPLRVEYQPVSMGFHDDNSSVAMALWREARAYYQFEGNLGLTSVQTGTLGDSPEQEFRQGNTLTGDTVRIDQETLPSLGMTTRPDDGRHFFDAIRLYDLGADPDSVNVYTYFYPIITSVEHDSLDYEDRAGQIAVTMSMEYEGYQHVVGLNNTQFNEVISQQLGFSSSATTGGVAGHARMRAAGGTSIDENGYPNINTPSLLDSLEGIVGTTIDDISFANVAAIPAVTPVTVGEILPADSIGEMSIDELEDIIDRTQSLFG